MQTELIWEILLGEGKAVGDGKRERGEIRDSFDPGNEFPAQVKTLKVLLMVLEIFLSNLYIKPFGKLKGFF